LATIIKNINKKTGEIVSYKVMVCVGRDEMTNKQIWRTCTLPRPEGMTPKKEEKEIERQADAWAEEQKADYSNSRSKKDKTKTTFSDFVLNHWWPDHVMDGSHTPSSISFYKCMSDDLVSYFNKKKLSSITGEDVKRYIKYLNTEAKTRSGDPLSANTIVRHYQTLRNIMNYAMRFDYLKEDPCKKLSVRDKPQKDKKKIDFLDPDQARLFLKCLDDEPLFWRCFMNVLITCGLRRGECIGLQWRDIDADKLTLTVSRNVTIDKDAPEKYRVGNTKTGEERVVPISQRVYGMLMQLKREQEERLRISIMPACYIFSRMDNPQKPIYPTEPTRFTSKFIKRHNLPNVSPHDLRHTAATLALEAGANLKEVQQLLGHKDASTTMTFYAGVTEEAQRRTVEGIESLIG